VGGYDIGFSHVFRLLSVDECVLVVDDEPGIGNMLRIKLRLSGYDVITALGGQEALDLVASAKPDIMLLDVIMPGVDGFEVLQKLRAYSQLPVIVFSARQDNAAEALELGANDFLAKPFAPEELENKIRSILGS